MFANRRTDPTIPDESTWHRLLAGMSSAVVLLALALAPTTALAQDDDFFRSSPGPLTMSHAELDTQDKCNDCHTGGRELSNDKCLDCHDHSDLRKRIRAGKGFHASAKVRGKKCESCHLEHKGRKYDFMGWRAVVQGGYKKFDHKLTGWPLRGKHRSIDCSECHRKRNKQGLRVFMGENSFCGSCHKDDQPHGLSRDEMACDRCHNESVWKPQKRVMEFDHNDPKDADMPLEGSHNDVRCSKCHPKAQFNLKKKDPDFCGNCHKSPHTGHLFDKKDCAWCHSPKYRTLETIRFNHAKRTRFDLAGTHDKLGCYECHTKQLKTRKPEKACERCHAEDNKHKSRFKAFGSPPKCELCHPSSSWKPRVFNHNKRTKFKLIGKHAQAECRSCHRGRSPSDFERFNVKTVGCMGCHKHKKAHNGEFKDNQCTASCHCEAGSTCMKQGARDIYHGPKSRFPLIKGHKKVKCAQCHLNDVYENTPMECGARCHEDSLHRGSLGDECSRCHSPGVWEGTRFDHTEDTSWPLNGLHKTVPKCEDCHPARQYSTTPKSCAAEGCHAKDDVHEGKLSQKCEECHLETGENIFDHNSQSDFALDGKHLTTRCSDCHPSITFKPRPSNCFGCHPEPDVHKGQYGTECENCHTTATWTDIRDLHDVGDFALVGSHDNIPCVRCHKDNRQLGGSGNLCINCHRQDDIHFNALSPRCGECHTQWSFAPARFDHSTVGCFLTGLHRTLPCYDCHKSGNFGGLSAQCYGCHRDTAIRKGDPLHLGYQTCTGGRCHNPNNWAPQVDIALPRESICR